ncbi:peptidase [Methylosinus sp. C49]|uniref:penicillin acylase family protein n=1 Tax=Methylosinus sp. C49 TaxID=2699395 RepID=UPI001367879A|nr:penicillin acylase family protein [Methylosinus sp. C49]BBU62175.1 peptidase [Methylosinus sp. C49]
MRRIWSLAGCVAVIALVAATAALYGLLRLPLHNDSGLRFVPGLHGAVEVAFDAIGEPHIKARDREDAYAALGYATARDRLFQMDLLRRKTGGRLAELFGQALVKDDSWSRAMGFERLAGEILRQLPPGQQAALTSYAAGVNQAMKDAPVWPWEFVVLGYAPEPWRREDSILVALGLADLSYSVDQERTASVMRAALPPAVVEFLTPESDCYNESLAPRAPDRCLSDALPPRELELLLHGRERTERDAALIGGTRAPRGSNGWVVAPGRTRDGRAILANDMHLALGLPNIWYRADLSYGPLRVEGLTLPGLPLVIAGTNGRVAWGLTSVEGDFADLVRLRLEGVDASTYRAPDGARDFSSRIERIGVRGASDVELRVEDTIWGPVLPDPLLGGKVALRWTMLEASSTNLGLIDMDGVSNVKEALPVLRSAGVPPLNGLLADSSGSIAWTFMGKMPKRKGFDGLFAEYWDDGQIGWDGHYTPRELPTIIDPASGFIVNANQRMLSSADFAPGIGHDYSGGYRAWRISQRLREAKQVDEKDMAELQLDTVTDVYGYYRIVALRALKEQSRDRGEELADLIRVLEDWDGRAEARSLGLPVLVEFRKALIESLLSPLLARCRKLEPGFVYDWSNVDEPVRTILESRQADLWPAFANGDKNAFLRSLLTKTAERLRQRHEGRSLSDIRWGDANRVEMAHPLAAASPILASLLNMSHAKLAGCAQCVRYYFAENGKSSGANARMVISPGRETDGLMQMAAGQSGQLLSDHYDDQQSDWVAGHSSPFRRTDTIASISLRPSATRPGSLASIHF